MESPAENLAGPIAAAETAPTAGSAPVAEYRCPGESYTISREVHLGRLAIAYPPCRECQHRHDTGVLSTRVVARVRRSPAQASRDATFTAEGVEGVYQNQITPRLTRELGSALGLHLRQQTVATRQLRALVVVLTGDDRPCSPELVAAASEGLRMCGCDVVEIAPATSACLVSAIAARKADGGMLIGNASGRAADVGIKLWGNGGQPLSSPGDLDVVRTLWQAGVDRPTRSCGGLERFDTQSAYLAGLRDYFHALRPLRFVLDTACRPLLLYLRTLLTTTACEVLPLSPAEVSPLVVTRFIGSGNLAGTPRSSPDPMNRVTTSALAPSVRSQRAHFGMWVDGDGEACRLVDEQGREIEAGVFVALLKSAIECEQTLTGTELPKGECRDNPKFQASAACTRRSALTRQEVHQILLENEHVLAGTNHGLIVFRDRPGAGDALRALAVLLSILSTSDRPLSVVMSTLMDGSAKAQ